ncbi:MAG: lipoate--protein ligase family protein [Planctomycetes bacterium]|nr:lipoate--protein ligase family protein [Planctomycetota bacterium]
MKPDPADVRAAHSVARCLLDQALPGAVNMARDAALLSCRLQPTLRFYQWLRPTLSLGYFQAAADLPLEQFKAQGFDLVRRRTGGKAILHHLEQTYSLCFPEDLLPHKGPANLMRELHQCLADEINQQAELDVQVRSEQKLASDIPGSPWCFEDSSALDLVQGRRKLVGSAARRSAGWILFHGSLVIKAPEQTPRIAELGFSPDVEGIRCAFGQLMGLDFEVGKWELEELEASERLKQQFESQNFLLRT